MTASAAKQLFTPVQVGPLTLKHRVVMAPLTRSRSDQPGGVPGDLMLEYYTQRASEGGLIIGEATNISPSARGWYGAPGLFEEAQIAGWKRITDAIHAKGGKIFAQLWHRTAGAPQVSQVARDAMVAASISSKLPGA